METLIEVNNLVKLYGAKAAVDNVSFKVEKGKIYGLLGPNGAGKTTIMKLITNMIKKTGGNIKYSDDLKVKYLMDVPVFYEYMTVEEFLNLLIDINKIENKEERLMFLLELSGLKAHKGKTIKQLSRGMRQKLGIATVMVNDVDVLILDEPVSALDPIGRKEVLDVISSLKGKVTVIFSSHILNDIEKICDHVILLNRGRIILNEDCENLFDAGNYLLVTSDNKEDILKLKGKYEECKFSSRYENTLELPFEKLSDTQLEVIKFARELDVEIISMKVKKETLEDIFLKKVNSHE